MNIKSIKFNLLILGIFYKNLDIKNLLFISLALIIGACSKSDESTSNEPATIVGAWELIKISHVCSSGFEDDYSFTNCQRARNIIFTDNGAIRSKSPNCIRENPPPSNGWYSINDRALTIIWEVDGTENITEIWDNFELYSNKLKISQNHNPVDDTCFGEGTWSHQYYEFERVE